MKNNLRHLKHGLRNHAPPRLVTRDCRFICFRKTGRYSQRIRSTPARLFIHLRGANKELATVGVLLGGEGLYPGGWGSRMRFNGGEFSLMASDTMPGDPAGGGGP